MFRNRNFSLIFLGNLVSSIGSSFYNFAIGWYILEITDKPLYLGTYLATGAVVRLILAPFGGVIVDRLNKVKIVYITDFIRGLVIVIAGILIYKDVSLTTTLIILYTCTTVLGINDALFGPAISSLQTEVVKEEELQTSQATMGMIQSLQGIIGILLAGFFYELLGVMWIFIINGVSYIFSGISEMFINHKYNKKFDDKLTFTSGIKDLKEGFKYLKDVRGLMPLMICALFLNFAFSPMFANGLPYLFEDILKTDALHLSFVRVGMSVGLLVGGILVGSATKNINVKNAVIRGSMYMTIIFAVITGAIYLVTTDSINYIYFLITIVALMFILGVINVYVNVPMSAAFVKKISVDFRGRAFSVMNTMSMAATPLAMVVGSAIVQYAGIITLGIYSTILMTIMVILLATIRSIRYFLNSFEIKEESKVVSNEPILES